MTVLEDRGQGGGAWVTYRIFTHASLFASPFIFIDKLRRSLENQPDRPLA